MKTNKSNNSDNSMYNNISYDNNKTSQRYRSAYWFR